MFDSFRKKVSVKAAQIRAEDERLYEVVAQELDRGERRPGLWVKAMADSEGSEEKASSLYLKYRVQSLKDDSVRRAGEALPLLGSAEEVVQPVSPETHAELVNAIERRGYNLKKGRQLGANKWVVKEPLGAQVTFDWYEDFKLYAERCIKTNTEIKTNMAPRRNYNTASDDRAFFWGCFITLLFPGLVLAAVLGVIFNIF
jgi:hypothetical protein